MTTAHVFEAIDSDLRLLMLGFGAERKYRLAWARCLIIDASRAASRTMAVEYLSDAIKVLDQQSKASYEPWRPSRSITTMQRDGLIAMIDRLTALRTQLARREAS